MDAEELRESVDGLRQDEGELLDRVASLKAQVAEFERAAHARLAAVLKREQEADVLERRLAIKEKQLNDRLRRGY